MSEIIKICQDNKIAMLSHFKFEEENGFAITDLLADEFEPTAEMIRAKDLLIGRNASLLDLIQMENKDGSLY